MRTFKNKNKTMKRFSKLIACLVFGGWLVLSPLLGLSHTQIKAYAQEEINPHLITGLTPAAGAIVTTSNPTVGATFNYQTGATYSFAKVYLDGAEDTQAANPSATGFSYNPNLVDGNHRIKVILVDNLNNVAIREWSFNLDSTPPSSSVGKLAEYTTDHNIIVPVFGKDNFLGIQKTELWFKRNNSDWMLGPVVVGLPDKIHFDADLRGGEGEYVFSTIAYDNVGLKEIKSLTAEAKITFDRTDPSAPAKHLIVVEQKAPGQEDAILGLPGSVSDDVVKIQAFSDSGLQNLIFTSPIYGNTGNKRIGAYGIGDNRYESIFIVAFDATGNRSQTTEVANDFGIAAAPKNINIKKINDDTALISWEMVNGADGYRIRYRKTGEQTFSDFIQVEESLNNLSVVGLAANTNYEFSVTTKDLHGNEGPIVFISTPTPVTTAPSGVGGEQGASSTPTPSTDTTTTQPPQTTTTKPPTDQQAEATAQTQEPKPPTEETKSTEETAQTKEETGEVKSEATEKTSRNWTPWIVLAILIILAGAATGGYFYWFGGPEEVTTTTKTTEERKEEKEKTEKDDEARW